MFNVNGYTWFIRFVNPYSRFLMDNKGRLSLAVTDISDRTIYISDCLHDDELFTVLLHELGHVFIASYHLDRVIHRSTHKMYWVVAEEWLCNYIADYGTAIYDMALYLMEMLS